MPTTSPFFAYPDPNEPTPLSTFMAHLNPTPKPIAPGIGAGGAGGGGPFTLNPATQPGVGPYGTVPGPIGKPPSLYQGAQTIYPGLAGLTDTAGRNIAHELAGDFSPETENALWDTANRFGVASGMPGAGLWSNRFMGNVAGAKEKLQQQGGADYSRFLGDLAKTTDDPNLLASIAARNATMAAAPNPEAAALALAEAYRRAQLDAASRARGPGGGTVNPYFNTSPGAGTVPRAATPPASLGPQSFNPAAYRNSLTGSPFTPNTWLDDISNPMLDQPSNVFDQPGQNYNPYGQPENTFYNPQTDTSNYEPLGDPWGLYGGGGADQPWGNLDQVATGNNYDPNSDMSDEDWWSYLVGGE